MNPTAREIERLQLILATLRRAGGRMALPELARRVGLPPKDLVDAVLRLQMVRGDEDRGYEYVDIDVDLEAGVVDLSRSDQGLGRRPLPLTPGEFAALAAAVRAACEGPAADLGAEASAVLAKVARHVTPGDPAASAIALPSPAGPPDRWAVALKAARAGEVLEIEYWSASRDEVTARPVAPRRLSNRDGTWYLEATCLLRGHDRRFRMDRVLSARATGRSAPPHPAAADGAASPAPAAPPEAVVRFAAAVAPWVRERQDPARVAGRPDGSIDVRIPYDSVVFLAGWVLSFAGQATVVRPQALRDEIRRRLARSFGPASD